MRILISNGISLSQVRITDKDQLIQLLNVKEVVDFLKKLPSPYSENDALWWINEVEQRRVKLGVLTNWAIRDRNDILIGGIGIHEGFSPDSFKLSIGYWLGRPYWNQGIMTQVLKVFCEYLEVTYPIVRIEAHIFEFNKASGKVLEKSGFSSEGVARNYYKKNGKLLNAICYARIKDPDK